MAKRVILAVAGAGKTYYICHAINPDRKNLILAFTNENIDNIKRELRKAFGCIPLLTEVMTFDSFLYRFAICPYEPSIAEYFCQPNFRSSGISMIDPPPQRKPGRNKKMIPNTKYVSKQQLGHYTNIYNQYYCATLAELVMQVEIHRTPLIKRIANRTNLFYDQVLIDEFQDFRRFDYEFIMALSSRLNDVLLVGDYYQHSVSAKNNSGKPFQNRNKTVSYFDFVKQLEVSGFEVDTRTLEKSRRCSKEVCKYVREKLGISIESCNDSSSTVLWADNVAKEILENQSIVKLVYSKASKYPFRAMNWSYSKGDTVDAACVIMTADFEKLDEDSFSPSGLSTSTINKLYVAMTRTSGNLYLIKPSTLKRMNYI